MRVTITQAPGSEHLSVVRKRRRSSNKYVRRLTLIVVGVRWMTVMFQTTRRRMVYQAFNNIYRKGPVVWTPIALRTRSRTSKTERICGRT